MPPSCYVMPDVVPVLFYAGYIHIKYTDMIRDVCAVACMVYIPRPALARMRTLNAAAGKGPAT